MENNANREVFLDHLAEKLGTKRHTLGDKKIVPLHDLATTTLADKSQAELLEIAEAAAEKIHTKIEKTTQAQLVDTVQSIIHKFGDGKVLFPTDARFEQWNLTELQENNHGYDTVMWLPDAREENIKNASEANVAVAFAEFLLAESATVVVESGAGQGRSLHFLPKTYISIVPMSKIVPRSTQAAQYYDQKSAQGESGSAINFISGPSNSGDIEMQLVVGVHGPIEVVYIVVEDL